MEFLFGAAVLAIVMFFIRIKRKTDGFNAQTLRLFPVWLSIFAASQDPQKTGIARAFLLQTLHLAKTSGALDASEARQVESGFRSENPVWIVNEWIDIALPRVVGVCGEQNLLSMEARLVGVLMLISVKGVNPEGDLRRFIESYNS